jgi:hypothetical protein
MSCDHVLTATAHYPKGYSEHLRVLEVRLPHANNWDTDGQIGSSNQRFNGSIHVISLSLITP